jgi:hypothetical protein
MKKHIFLILILVCFTFLNLSAEDKIPGQRPVLMIKDTFKFVPGSWADYAIVDKIKKETYRMYIATLEREIVKNVPCSWLEIEMEMKDQPIVVTKILAEETKDGPGKIMKAIIQVQGYSPFSVPNKYMEGTDKQVAPFDAAQIVKRLEQKTIVHKGKTISAVVVEAEDSKGEKTAATVSLELLPIAVYDAETNDMKMSVNDWGGGAKSKIKGTPVSFTLWIIEQIANGLTEKKK